ncbi:keratin-associated protein 10-4 isoform X2 [Eurytemora carolleeae]|uniref:keratin-associated protein 10-4 isoform X2 n=1 Tax=Eurytemora carolleeae TaxID=1294199 RepID=UPI000C768596|nr:keratin-associated protein 10-4 isoform X2 [Eurytemora carolleeae]|eukprot:XP_023349869.1 keratin-associated protein 10-4-like isoform X2 [Eurytemora affinis]
MTLLKRIIMVFWLKFIFFTFLSSGLGLQAPGDDPNPGCLPDDNAEPPACDDYTEQTFIPHPYNCSRFWECEPQRGHCLLDCPPINPSENLYFNPTINICDWPENVDCEMSVDCDCEAWQACVLGKCTPECKQDSHCTAEEYCNEGGNCVKGCRESDVCGSCGQCVDHVCQEPECCLDSDCQDASTCVGGICTEPLCSVDADCNEGEYCSTEGCIPGCTSDTSCPTDEYCDTSEHQCKEGCRGGNNCGTCGECVNHICQEPECCQDSDCKNEFTCVEGVCTEPLCSVDADCDEGEYCSTEGCIPGCTSDTGCPADEYCDTSEHQCKEGCRGGNNCGTCGECFNHICQEPECCQDSDCKNEFTCVEGVCTEPLCSVDADCNEGEYCSTEGCIPGCTSDTSCPTDEYCNVSEHQCKEGCRGGNNCGTCGECVNHICQEPECCQDSDCEDGTVCSTANVCIPGCRSSEDCPGWDQICNSSLSNCFYCNQITHQCTQGCDASPNCGGYACNNDHECLVGLQSITLKTQSCTGCQGAQGSAKEDGPFIILLGGGGQTCNTKQLDNPDKIDFDNGKVALFSDSDLLQSCDKADLGDHIIGGSVHWTANQGLWQPAKNQIQINWSDSSVGGECCCMKGPSLSSQNRIGSLYTCTKCSSHPGC